jgi:hypothetical protein
MRLRLLFAAAAAALVAFGAGVVHAHDMQHMTMDARAADERLPLQSRVDVDEPGRGERSAPSARRQASRGGDGLYLVQGHVPGDRGQPDVDRKHLPQDATRWVIFALFSIDSAVDTPAKLRAYADEHGLDPGSWTLFHGDQDAVRELAAALGVGYRPDGQGGFDHAALIALIDERGTQASLAQLVAALNSLLEKHD